MHLRTHKTTLLFSPSFIQQLKTVAQERRQSMSWVIEAELQTLFQQRADRQRAQVYTTLQKWRGSGSPHLTDASQTIDKTLYGK